MAHVKIERLSEYTVVINGRVCFIDSTGGNTNAPTNYICMESEPMTKNMVRGKGISNNPFYHTGDEARSVLNDYVSALERGERMPLRKFEHDMQSVKTFTYYPKGTTTPHGTSHALPVLRDKLNLPQQTAAERRKIVDEIPF